MTTEEPPSLEDFAAEQVDRRKKAWIDHLPDDIKAQILSSNASTRVIVKWLQTIGYEDATYSRVDLWRRQERNRERKPE